MLILISDAFDSSLPDKLKRFGEVTDDKSRLKEAEIVLVRSATTCTKEYIDGAPHLKLIIRGGVGIDNIDKVHAKEKGIQVRNTPKASSIAVAELAFALMIAIPARLVEGHNAMKEGKFLKKELKRTELHGKTLGLVGAGNIATELAIRAGAFGMKVLAFDPFVEKHGHAEMVGSLKDLVSQSHYVSLHTPLTDQTRGMINKEILGTMKDGAVLINTGRGNCVVAEDIAEALKSGKLKGYGTDVWPSDPPPEDYPLLKAPGVLMLPHLGASTKENLLRIGTEVEEIIEEYTKGGQS